MLTDTERQALHVAVCSCSDLSDKCLVRMDYDPGGLGLAVEAIVAAREATWRAPIEALAAEWEHQVVAYGHLNGDKAETIANMCTALRAALGSVSAPGNEAGQ